jgi:glycosyltransferase involved in cell wall biosynthesis
MSSSPIRVLELRSVYGTGGGPDKTLLASAVRPDDRVLLTLCYLRNAHDPLFSIADRARTLGVDVVEIHERRSVDPAIWTSLRRLMRERHFDIVHGHEYKTDLLAYLLSRSTGTIPFATAHGWTGHSWRERRLYYPADKRLLAWFPRVAAVSTEIKHELIAHGARPERIDVVLNGIDPEQFRRRSALEPEARARWQLGPGEIAVGSVGRLEPQKRFDLLIQAFHELADQFPAARLLIAGEGSLREALQTQIRSIGRSDRIVLTGQVDVIPFHHALDLFVQSSEYEGTPNVVLEAMALETAIVATDVGGTSELARQDLEALIVPAGSVPRLREAMLTVLSQPKLARDRALAARRRVETDLSFDHRMRRINAIYEELVTSAARTSTARRR